MFPITISLSDEQAGQVQRFLGRRVEGGASRGQAPHDSGTRVSNRFTSALRIQPRYHGKVNVVPQVEGEGVSAPLEGKSKSGLDIAFFVQGGLIQIDDGVAIDKVLSSTKNK